MKREISFILSISVLLALVSLPAIGRAQDRSGPVPIAAAVCPPFVMQEGENLDGLAIFLGARVARELGLDYDITLMNFGDMIDSVAEGRSAVGISCLSITPEREERVDFSHSFFETHKAIGIKKASYLRSIRQFLLSPRILTAIIIVLGAAALVGGIFYLLEHKINAKLYAMKTRGGKVMEALVIGMLFVTRGPIRYYEFKTPTARILSAVLAIGSTIMVASITAILASAFTLEQIRSEIRSPDDLVNVRVATLADSTSSEYLQRSGIAARSYDSLTEVVTSLEAHRVDAVVMDAPALKYEILRSREQGRFEDLEVLPYEFEEQNYAFALQDESEYVEVLNRALLSVRKSLAWDTEVLRYIGK
ncbi:MULTISPECIES: transporter substrate-binding domain-containing protein [unclassified Ruegeria]|uniref:transporter substrate-binding domain-containing protein n=1 Tax=unclassified Ruegeria TaxID=2625375 RepID=UPI0014895814|nr:MULTISPECIES: transporter substrate-binding domain-containing protein [unclassified Ruegeria]